VDPECAVSRLSSRRAVERLAAVRVLAADPEAHRDLLLRTLADRSNLVIAAATTGLAACRCEEAIRPLIERYWWLADAGVTRDSGCVARIAIVPALVACRASEASDVFFHAIRTVQPERSGNGIDDVGVPLRAQAAAALAELHLPGALLAVSLLLFDREPQVPHAPQDRLYITASARAAAARALAVLGGPGAVAVLGVRLAYDEDEIAEILVECMDAISSLDPEASLQLLKPYLMKNDPYLVAGAATSLARLPRRLHGNVFSVLVRACGEALPEAREPVALAIASMRSDEAVDALRVLTNHRDVSVRLAALQALEQRADSASIDVLRTVASRSGDSVVAGCAQEALARTRS
jgi:hypothetical protein